MRAQLARVDAVLIQALIAAALSFAHLHDIALAAGQDGWKAWAYPVSVDLLLVAAWRRLRSGATKAAGWCWFVIALAASLGANVATAGLLDLNDVPAWLRILVAGWPAVAFLGGTLLAHTAPTPVDEDGERTDDTVDQEDAPELDSEEPPELPPTPPAIEPPPPERSAVAVPAALVEHARKVAVEHHTRTGTPIDTPTLRARLGVPAPMAEAIAAHL
ncbi:DUF2637 domain-containing protein [Streptomyces ipomoeae]|jgi:hypothetical protein|uniref:DUF2637 domain-containing protein n=1 Tax=Streptomyces ipomoeae TaxID=103232 RepID=UPI001146E139|nr:DUF2637 domain-containing protein [Streptomyces ipomoeae]MDX2826234.1 DUF2637 domain-containing protein [Streptomyces ipomoeae]MDX2878899.1 DUF2637 domain-containing protein [Streptomyces ipomoeae]TQE38528.1 DUF2637 domain-containing protein [Streptomyces ipomoeae]